MATEVEKLERAKSYIESLINGVDPITQQSVQDESVLQNQRILRCFQYITEILEKVIENGGEISKKVTRSKMYPLELTKEQINKIELSEEVVPVSTIAERINAVKEDEYMAKITAVKITTWLMAEGYLKEFYNEHGKKQKVTNEQGIALGITTEERVSPTRGSYMINFYNRNAQHFVIEHLKEILQNQPKEDKEEFHTIESSQIKDPGISSINSEY